MAIMAKSIPPPSLASSQGELYRDDYVVLRAEPHGLLVRMTRSSKQHPSPLVMAQSYANVIAALGRIDKKSRALLADMREAVGRNDPAFEPVLRDARLRIDSGFMRIGVLLRTTAGLLQMRRFAEEEGILRFLSMDETEVLDYLRTGFAPHGMQLPSSRRSVDSRKRR